MGRLSTTECTYLPTYLARILTAPGTYPFLTPAQSPIPVENPGPQAALHRALVPAECTAPWVETHRVRRTTFVSHPRKACMCIEIRRS